MTRITVDEELRKRLHGLKTDLELCDESGCVLARVRLANPESEPDDREWLVPPVSADEIQRRLDSDEPAYTTEEVLEKLRRL